MPCIVQVRESAGGEAVVEAVERPAYEPVIEKLLVGCVVAAHEQYVAAMATGAGTDGAIHG